MMRGICNHSVHLSEHCEKCEREWALVGTRFLHQEKECRCLPEYPGWVCLHCWLIDKKDIMNDGKADGLIWVIDHKMARGEARIRITADFEQEILDEIKRLGKRI